MNRPPEPADFATLEAELRSAIQHRRAACERLQETQHELRTLLQRARALLERSAARPHAAAPPAEEAP